MDVRRLARLAIVPTFVALALSPTARSEHAKIDLTITTAAGEETAHWDQTPPPHGKNPRPVARAKVGEAIKLSWLFENIYPHKTLEDVVMHFYVAPIERVGKKELPTIGDDVLLETAFDMDFQPGGRAGGRHTLRIDKPGVYLVRVESLNTDSDHEHFAAVDLVVEP